MGLLHVIKSTLDATEDKSYTFWTLYDLTKHLTDIY